MSTLSTSQRNALPSSAFAIPGRRAYPIYDRECAQTSLKRVSANGTAEDKVKVRGAVRRKFPDLLSGGRTGGKMVTRYS